MPLKMCAIIRVVVVFPFEPGDGDDRDARRRALREQQVDHGLGDVLRLALRRVRVHAESRRRVHLDDGAAALANRLRDVGRDEVDAGDVQPDHRAASSAISTFSSCASNVRSIEMPPVDMLPVAASFTHGVLRRDVGRARIPARGPARSRRSSTLMLRQDLLVADAAPRVGVRRLDELGDRVLAVADHVGRDALGDRDHVPADDQDPVVVAGHVATRRRPRRVADLGSALARSPSGRASSSRRSRPTPRPWLPSSGFVTTG